MNLNNQTPNISNLLLQKRDRRLSEITSNAQVNNDTIEKDETEMSRPFAKTFDMNTKFKNYPQCETIRNKEFNIIPPTIKPTISRRMSLNSNESRTICNCKNSQCLKLYCECFATMSYCDPKLCSCKNCMNTIENDEIRRNAINSYFIKSPNSFKKIITSQLYGFNNMTSNVSNIEIGISPFRSCTCKKSNCLKRYCECYQSGLSCNPQCKCLSCKNTKSGLSEENSINSGSGGNLLKSKSNTHLMKGIINTNDESFKFGQNNKAPPNFNNNINSFNLNNENDILHIEGESLTNHDLNEGKNKKFGNFSNAHYTLNRQQESFMENAECNLKFNDNTINSQEIQNNFANSQNNLSNFVNKNEKYKSKNLIFDKIFFERKKEEITPYKIIINDYVVKRKEYEVDNN